MPLHSVAKSAAQYGFFWQRSEQALVTGLESRNRATRLATLQKAAGYFRVARNFPMKFDVARGLARLEPALDILDGFRSPALTPTTFVDAVNTVRREFAIAYGKSDLLSAATKLLWLVHQHPVVIFDGNVKTALGASGSDYDMYLHLWNQRFQELEPEIRQATAALQRQGVGPAGEEWFRRRVLDIHLWYVGGVS
jgi:hypothetical protein